MALSGQATLKSLWAIGKAEGADVRLEGCDQSWVLGTQFREKLRHYVRGLVRIHKQRRKSGANERAAEAPGGSPPPAGDAEETQSPTGEEAASEAETSGEQSPGTEPPAGVPSGSEGSATPPSETAPSPDAGEAPSAE